MSLYHLKLLVQKSLRYAWRLRTCRCCPKILCEFLVPIICLLFLCLLRWIHTPTSSESKSPPSFDATKPTRIQLTQTTINSARESLAIFDSTSIDDCPPTEITIEIFNRTLARSLRRQCPQNSWVSPTKSSASHGNLLLNTSSNGYALSYRCTYYKAYICQNVSALINTEDTMQIQHPSGSLCSNNDDYVTKDLLKAYFALHSRLYPTAQRQKVSVYTWPCSSYISDVMFQLAPRFVLAVVLILIDGCILFSFSLLVHALMDEKRQGITEMLRLISIRPILNSFAWFLRVLAVQLIPSILLIAVLKISFEGGVYLPFVSIWFIAPSILLWTVQVLSRAVLVAHFFTSNLKATIWSWLMYFLASWLALSTSVRIPMLLHLMLSAWCPFYAIKRLFILLVRINADLGRETNLTAELLYIWLSMVVGSLLMWLLAYYFGQIQPGKYGIPRSWSWPLDRFRRRRIKNQKRRESSGIGMVRSDPDENITVRVNNLTKTYGGFHREQQVAVDHLSFQLEKSKIHGLIGHNGAGKTTTMEMMCGLLPCDCGSITINGKCLVDNLQELLPSISYCPQQDMLFSHLTVREQLEFYARVRSHGKNIDSKEIDNLLAMMDMKACSHRLCHALSGGMQRKLSILCAFVGQASVILLDEPSSSLDPAARRVLWSWLRERKFGRTLLVSSHLLDEVEELCDSVLILDSGKIRAQDTVLELKRQYGPSGDRLHLGVIPDYVPKQWIVDGRDSIVQVPDRRQLVQLLERLENDQIKYSLENVTLDDIFLKLTSTSEGLLADEATVHSQINKLFEARTATAASHLWSQQILAVVIRRARVFLRRARLLPLILLLYLAYALAPLYMPSFTLSSAERIRYVLSSTSPQSIRGLPLKSMDVQLAPSFASTRDFQQYLSEMSTWQPDHRLRRKLVGLRLTSVNQLECFVPSPVLYNVINWCVPILSALSNSTSIPLKLIDHHDNAPVLELPSLDMLKHNPIYYCFYTLPPSLHLSIVLLSLILLLCAALTIQDYTSGIHSYSLIHGLRSPIHWLITFLSDLLLCLAWLAILVLIARFVHASSFNGRFFALTPLFFIANLPFIYLIAKMCSAPILGGTMIITLLQFAHILNTFKFVFEFLRGYQTLSMVIYILRWLLLLVFPNVNVFILIVAILRPYSCVLDDAVLDKEGQASHERYPHKVLIHTLIFLGQFLLHFTLLILIDTCQLPILGRKIKGRVNHNEEDNDVAEERRRVESMNEQERRRVESMNEEDGQSEVLIVDNLSKRYFPSSIPAVNRLTFAVPRRQCFGLLGFNGSGKTTTFRMLVGDLRPSGGHVLTSNGESLGYCPQDDISFSALTVLQSIDYVCRLHGLKPSLLNDLVITQFQLERYRHRLVSRLSGGTRRRLHLALCLIGSPTLLLLDEPTAKVDPLLRGHIRLILQHRPVNTSLIFASHSMVECEQLCDRLTILVHGNARCLGSPRHLKEKYGTDYRVRLTLLQPSAEIPDLQRVDNSDEYIYPRTNLSALFKLCEQLVQDNIIAPNYTVQLTSLEHIFLTFQHPREATA